MLINIWKDNEWVNNSLQLKNYSDPGLIKEIFFKNWNDGNWEKHAKTTYYYSENENKLDSLIVKFSGRKFWRNYLKRIVIRDEDGDLLKEVEQIWNQSQWENNIRRNYSTNEDGNIKNVYAELWENNEWKDGNGEIFFETDNFKGLFFTNQLEVFYSQVTKLRDAEYSQIRDYTLSQNYPNPFNPVTTIEYSIPNDVETLRPDESGQGATSINVILKVYDILGREVKTLVNQKQTAGKYEVKFNASELSSGVYIYKLQAGDYQNSKKLILMK